MERLSSVPSWSSLLRAFSLLASSLSRQTRTTANYRLSALISSFRQFWPAPNYAFHRFIPPRAFFVPSFSHFSLFLRLPTTTTIRLNSYDHRLLDGREAVTFLVRVKQLIEDPRRFNLV